MQEFIEAVRAIWRSWATGERLGFEGRFYRHTLMTENFAPEGAAPPPPIYLAAVGPLMGAELHRRYGDVFDRVSINAPYTLAADTADDIAASFRRSAAP